MNLLKKIKIGLHYFWLIKKIPKSIQFTEKEGQIRINGKLCGYGSNQFYDFELIEEIDEETWSKYYS